MTGLAIIADDLTGALDSAAPFAVRGARVSVVLDAAALPEVLADAPDVIAISTDSREVPAPEAAARVGAVAAQLGAGTTIFKKVDSRLKGNVAAELSALGFRRLLVSPAIPEFGRVVSGGFLTGFGVDHPIRVDAVLGPFAAQAEVPDSPDQAALDRAVAASDADLFVGARGLAEAVARRLFPAPTRLIDRLPGPRALFVVGSRDPITLAQIAGLRAAGTRVIEAPNGVAPPAAPDGVTVVQAIAGDEDIAPAEVAHRLAASVVPALTDGCATLLLTGGATAAAVLSRLGIGWLELLGECRPGLPVSKSAGITFVTKSGGFGDAQTLLDVGRMVADH